MWSSVRYHLTRRHPGWYLPEAITDQEWRKALIFVRLVDTLSVEPESVRRDSRCRVGIVTGAIWEGFLGTPRPSLQGGLIAERRQ